MTKMNADIGGAFLHMKNHDDYEDYISNLSKANKWSQALTNDVIYLRTRSRWTKELEAELIEAHQRGDKVNICDFGVTEQTQQAMHDLVKSLSDKYRAKGEVK